MPRAKNGTATAEKKASTRTRKSNGTTAVSNEQAPQLLNLNEEQIRLRAYELYERRGRQDGAHDADWFAAEAELRSRTA